MKPKLSNKQIKRIAKQIKGQTPTLEELDETFEQDEAHASFQKMEQDIEELHAHVESVLDNIPDQHYEEFVEEFINWFEVQVDLYLPTT